LRVSNSGLVDQEVALSLEKFALLSSNFLHDFDVENEKKSEFTLVIDLERRSFG
jgi:hypothetical protein